jgi:V/A-type H+-transporting ATPase subunit I
VSFLRPLPMAKIGVVGLKDDREVVLSVLHDLGVLQVEPLSKEALEQISGEPGSAQQRAVSDQLIRFRGLKSALPPVPVPAPRRFAQLEEILALAATVPVDEEVGQLSREDDRLLTDRTQVMETVALLDKFGFYTERLGYLNSKSLLAFFGEATPQAFAQIEAEVPALADAVHFLSSPSPTGVLFLVAVRTDQAEAVGRIAQQHSVKLTPVPRLDGTPAEERPLLAARRLSIDARRAAIHQRLTEIAQAWYPTVLSVEEALTIENTKMEVFSKLGAGRSTFALEGWIPKRERARIEATLTAATTARTHVYDLVTSEEPPTIMENPPGIRWYEFFIRFYSLPQATEWDPTFTFALIFPILFGFMLGDVGYAVVIMIICIWMIYGFPGREHLPGGMRRFLTRIMGPSSMQKLAYALIPGCLVGVGVGVLTNSYFGFSLGYNAVFNPLKNTGTLLLFAGFLGLGMVLFGFILGALKEYFHHRVRHAWAKIGGILASLGLVGFGLSLLRGQITAPHELLWGSSLGVLAVGVGLMFYGEGVNGVLLGFIEVLSHILSYTRIVGILLASVILALVIDGQAWGTGGGTGLVHANPTTALGILYIVMGIVILIGGQIFNVVLGVFEPGIQGARLIFVEHFSKFYGGNGKAFRPLRSERRHTESAFVQP